MVILPAMNIILETKRLFLRTFTEEDAQYIYDLNINPEVTRYTHYPVRDPEHAKEILIKTILPQYVLYNHGRWAVHLKENFAFIGWCGLKYRAEEEEVDLGYRFKQEYWGRGFATEAAIACINYGFETLNIRRIVGRTEPENIASCLVLEKCGMRYMGEAEVDGYPVKTYEIYNPA